MECPKGMRLSKKGRCVKRCFKGTYKKKGECIPRPSVVYCPPGFHKGVHGKCVRKRCPKGSIRKMGKCMTKEQCLPGKHKNKNGRCVKDFKQLQFEIKKALVHIRRHPDLEEKLVQAMKKYEHRLEEQDMTKL